VGRQSIELAVGATHCFLSLLLGPEWSARSVCFTHSAPANLEVHRRLFGHSVRFSQAFNGIVLRSTDLDTPMPWQTPVMRSHAHQMLAETTPTQRTRTRHEVQHLIMAPLQTGRCNADQVALHMGGVRQTQRFFEVVQNPMTCRGSRLRQGVSSASTKYLCSASQLRMRPGSPPNMRSSENFFV